jgi:hypothetical protein
MSRVHPFRACLGALLVVLIGRPALAEEAPTVADLRTQRVGDTTYFHVTLRTPSDLRLSTLEKEDAAPTPEARRRVLARLPRLVPQDDRTAAVYFAPHQGGNRLRDLELDFVGKVHGDKPARLLLLYPTDQDRDADKKKAPFGIPALLPPEWTESMVTLDWRDAERIERPKNQRDRDAQPARDDLEGLWAAGQAQHFAFLEAQTPEFGFYGFAREATGRKYHVPARPLVGKNFGESGDVRRRLYETTTGAAALTESLALRRMLHPNPEDSQRRTIDLDKLPGIDIAEHPWEKMMGDKKPAPEPLAKLVPHDNYYVTFKSVRKFIEFGEWLDQWGTNLARAYEMNSRDYQMKERYEKQLCIKSTGLGKTLGPALIRGVAITGSDLYVREGSDITVIFEIKNRALFLAAVEPFLEAARKEYGGRLKEAKSSYGDVTIENFATPLREVSLHRAAVDDFVIYSNSYAALRRVLDTHAGKRKALADSLDYKYMRTIFRRDDEKEDGFAFLSDAFIRQLVGPASKIKEKRRLEALTSLSMVTNGALFAGWETGKLPADHKALMTASGLKAEEIAVPEGEGVAWNGEQQVAVSDAYNTIHFTTPLIELPIDRVTEREEIDYLAFRRDYLNLWRRFFDPVGMRFALNDKRVQVETYILPLIQSNEYAFLRQFAGGGTATLDTSAIPSKTLFQFFMHLTLEGYFRNTPEWGVGDWVFLRWEDGSAYRKLAELAVRLQMEDLREVEKAQETFQVFCQLPMTLGVSVRNAEVFDKTLREFEKLITFTPPDSMDRLKPAYKGVTITRVRFAPDGQMRDAFNPPNTPKEKRFALAFYYARVEDAWYLSLSESALRDQIDRSLAQRDRKDDGKKETVQVNSSVYVAPEAAYTAAKVLRGYLEWETHRRAVANGSPWYALHRAGVLAQDASEESKRAATLKFFGFVPVSPDATGYRYRGQTDEVMNERHGSLRKPQLHGDLDEKSPVAQLLEQLRTVRADLRFREDGIHTVVTLERRAPGK